MTDDKPDPNEGPRQESQPQPKPPPAPPKGDATREVQSTHGVPRDEADHPERPR